MESKLPRYMMATKAYHMLGDISRDEPDLCLVDKEIGDSYFGAWVTGFGFVEVRFPKATTRELTAEETAAYNKKSVAHSNGMVHRLKVD